MENEPITITLTVAQWQAVLGAVEHAPYLIVNAVSPILVDLHTQAAHQMSQLQNEASEDNDAGESDFGNLQQ